MKPGKLNGILAASLIGAHFIWQLLFYDNPYLKDSISEIQIIFLSICLVYFLIRYWVKDFLFDFLKVFVRTLFRVWLLVFLTFAITQSMKRVGIILSITFIFGYFEGLLDTDKWLSAFNPLQTPVLENGKQNKKILAASAIMLMSWIHILCAVVVKVVSLFLGQLV